MAKVFAGLGSNIDPEDNLHLGVRLALTVTIF
jgi:hypothetical protein